MKSYTTLRNLYGSLTNNTKTGNLTLGDQLINDGYRKIIRDRDWHFLYKSTTATTTASTQFYQLPADVQKLNAVTITVSSVIYTPEEIVSEEEWQKLNQNTNTSDVPEYYFIRAGRIGFYPTPASTSNTITYYYRRNVKDLSIADYTTGGILTATNAAAAIVGTGTTWTAPMAGRYLRITDSDSASKGDGFWYEISSSGSATTITLVKTYQGTSIASGNAAYTIGQMPILPEEFHELPVYSAVAEYYALNGDVTRAREYERKFTEGLQNLRITHGSKTDNVVLDYGEGRTIDNPNLYVRSIS